jgi:hypothetical protein
MQQVESTIEKVSKSIPSFQISLTGQQTNDINAFARYHSTGVGDNNQISFPLISGKAVHDTTTNLGILKAVQSMLHAICEQDALIKHEDLRSSANDTFFNFRLAVDDLQTGRYKHTDEANRELVNEGLKLAVANGIITSFTNL